MVKGYLVSLLLIGIWILTQIVLFQSLRPSRKFALYTKLFIVTVPLYVLLYAYTPVNFYFLPSELGRTPLWLGLFNGLFVHFLLYCTYAEFFYYVDRPLTLRILIEILKSPRGFLKVSDLEKFYSTDEMIKSRAQALLLNHYLQEKDGVLKLTSKGRFFAKGIRFLRGIFPATYYLDMQKKPQAQ